MRQVARMMAAAAGAMLALACMVAPAQATTYPAPSGNKCTTSGPSVCWLIAPTDAHAQQQHADATSGRYGWWAPLSGAFTLNKPMTCSKGFASRALWQQYGAPTSLQACVFVGGEWAVHTFERYLISDLPAAERSRFTPARMTITELRAIGGSIIDRPTVEITAGSPLSAYCDGYVARDAAGRAITGVAIEQATSGVLEACGFRARQTGGSGGSTSGDSGDVETDVEVDVEEDAPSDATPQLHGLQTCGVLVVPRTGRVDVRMRSVGCLQARRVLARFVRDGRQSRGWSCSRAVVGARRAVTCTAGRAAAQGPSRPRATVVGTWAR